VKDRFGRSEHALEDDIKTHLKEIGYEVEDWIYIVQDRVQW
jgi:hypothetical protein